MRTLLAAFLYFDVSFMVWMLIGALGVLIAQELGLSATQKGVLVAVPLLSGAAMRVLVGFLVDRFGPKRMGVWSLVVMLLPLFWGWQAATSLPELLGIGLLLGVAGASFAVALPLASRWSPPERQGLAMGIAGAGNSGTVLAVLLAPRLAQLEGVGWHGVFGLAMILVALMLGAFFLLAREAPDLPPPWPLAQALAVLREPDLWWFSVFYSVTFGGFVGLASFLGIFFHDQYKVAAVTAGALTASCVCAGSVFRPVGGWFADRLGGLRVLGGAYGFAATMFLGIAHLPSLPVAAGLMAFGLLALGMGNGAVFQMVPQRFRGEIGVVTGIVGAAGGLGGFLLPPALGALKDWTGSFGTGFLAFALVSLGALAPISFYRRRWLRAWSPKREPFLAGTGTAPRRIRMEVVFRM